MYGMLDYVPVELRPMQNNVWFMFMVAVWNALVCICLGWIVTCFSLTQFILSADVHHITTPEYQLWHLQPDTEYELAVTLVRPGPGGTGVPGPKLRKKTKCGPPKTTVQNVKLTPLTTGEDSLMRVEWDVSFRFLKTKEC